MDYPVIASFCDFNERRYGVPWVGKVTERGKYVFSSDIGTYTGTRGTGEGGDLVVFEPIDGQVYAYGQKDHRGHNSVLKYAKWDASQGKFIPCTRLGGKPRSRSSYARGNLIDPEVD